MSIRDKPLDDASNITALSNGLLIPMISDNSSLSGNSPGLMGVDLLIFFLLKYGKGPIIISKCRNIVVIAVKYRFAVFSL